MQSYEETVNELFKMVDGGALKYDASVLLNVINFITYQKGVIDGMREVLTPVIQDAEAPKPVVANRIKFEPTEERKEGQTVEYSEVLKRKDFNREMARLVERINKRLGAK